MSNLSSVVLAISARSVSGEAVLISKMLNMYTRYAESHGWQVELLPAPDFPTESGNEVVRLITGESTYSKLRYETGIHRVQWVPTTEHQGRVFTAKAAVTVVHKAGNTTNLVDMDSGQMIRTYNISQNRVTDHRIGLTLHGFDLDTGGDLEPMIQALADHFDDDSFGR